MMKSLPQPGCTKLFLSMRRGLVVEGSRGYCAVLWWMDGGGEVDRGGEEVDGVTAVKMMSNLPRPGSTKLFSSVVWSLWVDDDGWREG
jgi:hypothetical protein